jgi:hypothetical protein
MTDVRDPSLAGRVLAVIPVLDWAIARPCIDSIAAPDSAAGLDPSEVLIVDNAREAFPHYAMTLEHGGLQPMRYHRDPDGHNLGVARSWNIGARAVLDEGQEYLIVCSSVMRFGPLLHTSWLAQMERVWGARVIECDGHSWHLIAFHRTVLETVGLFDENFYPGYVEGIDYGLRLRMLGWEGGWPRMWVNALSAGVGAHVDMVSCPWTPLNAYYMDKWGGPKGEETHTRPWGDKALGYFPEHSIPELAEKYGLEVWW